MAAYVWVLFGVKPLKYLYFVSSGIEKSEDWLTYLNENWSLSSVHDRAVEGCFLAILL